MNTETVLILANGDWGCGTRVRALSADATLVIAADGGWNLAREHRIRVDEVVGDMDSLSGEAVQALNSDPTLQVIRFPSMKDWSDLELALERALRREPRRIDVYGAFGGRLDHTLVNVNLVVLALDAGIRLRLVSDAETLHALRGGGPVAETWWNEDAVGRLVSLIPLTEDAVVRTEGLRYPLNDEGLRRAASRGVSNVIVGKQARVVVSSGDLIVVESEDRDA